MRRKDFLFLGVILGVAFGFLAGQYFATPKNPKVMMWEARDISKEEEEKLFEWYGAWMNFKVSVYESFFPVDRQEEPGDCDHD